MDYNKELSEVQQALQHQLDKWGVQSHDDLRWLAILMEEVGEVSQELIKPLEEDWPKDELALREELAQVAAVAIAWMENLYR